MTASTKPEHRKFVEDMTTAGLRVRHYQGRNFYCGLAVEVDDIQTRSPGQRSMSVGPSRSGIHRPPEVIPPQGTSVHSARPRDCPPSRKWPYAASAQLEDRGTFLIYRILLANSGQAISRANRDFRVAARGTPSSQSQTRLKFIATAVATCCRCAFASPRYLARRRPNDRDSLRDRPLDPRPLAVQPPGPPRSR